LLKRTGAAVFSLWAISPGNAIMAILEGKQKIIIVLNIIENAWKCSAGWLCGYLNIYISPFRRDLLFITIGVLFTTMYKILLI